MKLGRNLARTFLDYYKLQNHIVFNPSASIAPKLPLATTSTKSGQSSSASSNNGGINLPTSHSNGTLSSASSNNNFKGKRSSSNLSHSLKPLSQLNLNNSSSNSLPNQTLINPATETNTTPTTSAAANNNNSHNSASSYNSALLSSRHSTKFFIDNGFE